MDINWRTISSYVGVGILGILLAHYAFPRQVEKIVEVEVIKTVDVERKVIEYVDREVVKWRTRVEYRQDGSVVAVEKEGSEIKEEKETATVVAETAVEQATLSDASNPVSLTRYTVSVQADWKTTLNPADLSNYRLTAGARIGSLPVVGEVYVQGDLGFGIGVRYEW